MDIIFNSKACRLFELASFGPGKSFPCTWSLFFWLPSSAPLRYEDRGSILEESGGGDHLRHPPTIVPTPSPKLSFSHCHNNGYIDHRILHGDTGGLLQAVGMSWNISTDCYIHIPNLRILTYWCYRVQYCNGTMDSWLRKGTIPGMNIHTDPVTYPHCTLLEHSMSWWQAKLICGLP